VCVSPTPILLPYTTLFRSPGTARAPSVVLLRRPQRLHRGGGQVQGRQATVGARDAGRRRRRGCTCAATALPHADRGLDAHGPTRSEEHTSELQSRENLVCG